MIGPFLLILKEEIPQSVKYWHHFRAVKHQSLKVAQAYLDIDKSKYDETNGILKLI